MDFPFRDRQIKIVKDGFAFDGDGQVFYFECVHGVLCFSVFGYLVFSWKLVSFGLRKGGKVVSEWWSFGVVELSDCALALRSARF